MLVRRFRTALLVLGATYVTAACGGPSQAARPEPTGLTGEWSTAGCEFQRVPETAVAGRRAVPTTPDDLAEAVDRIREGGEGKWARSYAGVEVDQARVRAIVYRVPSAAFDKFVRNSARDTCVVVRDARHGRAELRGWHDRVIADLEMWQKSGVRLSRVTARDDGAGLEIGTPDVVRARAELTARYGATAPLLFVPAPPVVPRRTD
jgi:hypothetical protein